MSTWDELKNSIRKIVLMEEKLNQLSSGLSSMIELAQARGGSGPKRLS